jgi:hypothetical protein
VSGWSLEIVAAGVVIIALKLMSGVASGMKQKMDTFHEEDPIVSFFAWLDRATTFHKR